MRRTALLLFLTIAPACKDGASNDKGAVPDPTSEVQAVASDPKTKATPDQAPGKLSETPLVLFDARTGHKVTASWSLGDEVMLINAHPYGTAEGGLYQVDVYGTLPDTDNINIYSCANLKVASSGRVELLLRGDKLHLLCINPPHGEDPGWTEAVRQQFRVATRDMWGAGSYSGEGVVDPDTIDLDEAEVVTPP